MKKDRLFLFFIAAIFLSPVVVSWWVLNHTDIVSEGVKSNHGDLIIPPKQIGNLNLFDPIADRSYALYGKWSLLYITDNCDQHCLENLYRMRQIHIAMDKHSLRVQRILFLSNHDQPIDHKILFADYTGLRLIDENAETLKQLLPLFQLNKGENPTRMNRLYIIDPLGGLMMSYAPDANPRGIMKDLRKLLKASKTG